MHGINDDLNQAFVSLGFVLVMFVVFINRCLGFMLSLDCSYVCVASTSQVIG